MFVNLIKNTWILHYFHFNSSLNFINKSIHLYKYNLLLLFDSIDHLSFNFNHFLLDIVSNPII